MHDLVRWADVVTESFSPKAMRAWGFDYESLRKVKPDIIMLSTCLMGQTGPLAKIAGFGNMAAAISGFNNLTGWPDRPPAGVFGAYTDYVAPRFTAISILAALEYRRRTGQGQYIDQSQAECAIHFLGPAILDYTVNGRVEERAGNSDAAFAPHGVYPAAGDDRWVAIVCRDDDDWRRLCAAMENEILARDSRYASAAGRLEHRDAIDSSIAAWSRKFDRAAIESRFSRTGCPLIRYRTAPTRIVIRSSRIAAISSRSTIRASGNSRSRVLARNSLALLPLSDGPRLPWDRTINTCSKAFSATTKRKSPNWWRPVHLASGASIQRPSRAVLEIEAGW